MDEKNRAMKLVKSNPQKAPHVWESPVSLSTSEPPQMPDDLLPGVIGEYANAVSAATETPLELSVGLILPTIATCVHNKFQVQVEPGYCEPLSIWTVTALESGNRKSAVQSKMSVKPLLEWESEEAKRYKPLIDMDQEEKKS